MTRATLGHTGRPLEASSATQAVYLLAVLAAVLRVVAALTYSLPLIELSALLWIAAFAGYLLAYGPLLLRQRPVWQQNRC